MKKAKMWDIDVYIDNTVPTGIVYIYDRSKLKLKMPEIMPKCIQCENKCYYDPVLNLPVCSHCKLPQTIIE